MVTESSVTLVIASLTVVELGPERGANPKRGAATGEV
jgi:hypothetical protein